MKDALLDIRLKRTLFIMTKHNIRIFRVIPFFELQNSTRTTAERWDPCLLLKELFRCVVLVPGASGRLACSSANTGREGCTAYIAVFRHLYTVVHTAVCPHLYTLSSIQSFPHTCTYCRPYSRFPTPVHTAIHEAVSPHLSTLSYIQQFSHTCTHFQT